MPDLMTHFTASYLLKRSISPKHNMVPFLVGATLPDIMGYIPLVVVNQLHSYSIPGWLEALPHFFLPFHSIVGFTLLSSMVALLFSVEVRQGVFLNLELGGLLHFAMDTLQIQHGESSYLLFPFSWRPVELGWIGTESSLYALPFFIAAAAIVFLVDHFSQRVYVP